MLASGAGAGSVSAARALELGLVHEQLFDGRPFRLLTVVDQLSRESLLIEVGFSMSGQKVAEALDRCLLDGPMPISLTVDHGTEFTSKALEEWAWQRGVKLDFTRPVTVT